jgi:hypothetical protein
VKYFNISKLISNFVAFSFLLSLFTPLSYSQSTGKSVYNFLKLDPSAHSASMGGSIVSLYDADIATSLMNPAALSEKHHNNLSLNYNNYFADINYGYAAYAHKLERENKKPVMLAGQLLYMDYGKFDGYDETGSPTGIFTASDLMIGATASQQINEKFNAGLSLKWIYSILETYVSNGIAFDFGANYSDTARLLSMGLVMKNLGWQNQAYRETQRAPLPFEIQFGVSKKLKHAPFRLSLLFHNLQQADLSYDYTDPLLRRFDEFNNPINQNIGLGDKILRHMNLGTEVLLSENFNLRFSYNHMRRQELGTAIRKGVAGFAWGVGFKVKKIRIEYGSAGFFPGYNSNLFSVILNLNEFYN